MRTEFTIGEDEEEEQRSKNPFESNSSSSTSIVSEYQKNQPHHKKLEFALQHLTPLKHKEGDKEEVYTRSFNLNSVSSSFIFPIQESHSPPLTRQQSTLSIQEQITKQETTPKSIYSIYTAREKYFIVILGAFCGLWSSISSPIYLPCLPILEADFNVSEGVMNTTVVVYSIFQGLAPIFFSNVADRFGRRLIILICLMVYTCANVGLAVNSNFIGLILLRCLQAFGISSTISIASGIVTDVTQRYERGSFMGLSTGLSLLGQAFGALLGGLLESWLGWRSIFWFLTMAGASTFIFVLICLPETSRALVGNGSSLPTYFIGRAPIMYLKQFKNRITSVKETNDSIDNDHKILDLLTPFKILHNKEVYLTLIPSSLNYALWLMMLTTLSTTLSKDYHYSTLEVGLLYLPAGSGGFFGSFTSGQFLTWYYKRQYKLHLDRVEVHQHSADATKQAPIMNIFRTRLTILIFPTILSVAAALLFGWSINGHLSVSAIIVSSFFISYSAMFYMTVSSTLLVDIFPGQSSASTSCVNLTRCLTAALFIAVLSKMVATMTAAGCYSFMAALCFLSSFCVYIVICKGEQWFEQRQVQNLEAFD